MALIIKSEWHQVERRFSFDLNEDLLSEIYPELNEAEIEEMLQQIVDGELLFEEVLQDAYDNNIEIEWEWEDDDWWTDRKGGYEVTYQVEE